MGFFTEGHIVRHHFSRDFTPENWKLMDLGSYYDREKWKETLHWGFYGYIIDKILFYSVCGSPSLPLLKLSDVVVVTSAHSHRVCFPSRAALPMIGGGNGSQFQSEESQHE